MPMAIPLIAAYAAVSAGVAIAATSMVVGGMMIAGGFMTALGTIAKKPKMAKMGGLLSLAGGAAGMASGAWNEMAQSAATDAAGKNVAGEALSQTPTAGAALDAGATTAANGGNGTGAVATASPVSTGGAVQSSPLQSMYGGDLAPGFGAGVDAGTGGIIEGNLPGASAPAAAPAATTATPALGQPAAAAATPTAGAGAAVPAAGTTTTAAGDAAAKVPSALRNGSSVWEMLRQNPEMVKLGAGLIQGASAGYNQNSGIKAQQQYDQQRRNQYNDSLRNLRAPVYQPAGT